MLKSEEKQTDSLEELLGLVKLDYSSLVISYDDNMDFIFEFPVTPSDYLRFARIDLNRGDPTSLINAICNAKRCIDCSVDTTLTNLNINPRKISRTALQFCNSVLGDGSNEIKPHGLRLFSALGFAPTLLITEVRSLRNDIEHEYVLPDEKEAKRAVELAELLLNNVKAKEIFSCGIWISDDMSTSINKGYSEHRQAICFHEKYDSERSRSTFELRSYTGKDSLTYIFQDDSLALLYLLRAMFVAEHDEEALKLAVHGFLQNSGSRIPLQHFNVKYTRRF